MRDGVEGHVLLLLVHKEGSATHEKLSFFLFLRGNPKQNPNLFWGGVPHFETHPNREGPLKAVELTD